MKIATVTLNPALDQTVRVDHFRPDTVNYGQTMEFTAGGKGINVASFLADAGFAPGVTGFLGQDNADIFERFFARKGLEDHFIRIPGSTRIGVKIVDEANQQTTDINMPGLPPSPQAMAQLAQTIEQLATTCDWFVLSGTLPPDLPAATYATLIRQLKASGKQIVLDTSREALREGVQAGPTIVKPNLDELRHLTGLPLVDEPAIELAARQLLKQGIQMVVVSMGENGALFVDAAMTVVALPPQVTVKSTVGAGDAMVAGLLVGQSQGLSLADCARLATAFSLERITQPGSQRSWLDGIQTYTSQVNIRLKSSLSPHTSL